MPRIVVLFVAIAAALATRSAAGIETARVALTDGVPQLLLDDKPVPARVFFGRQASTKGEQSQLNVFAAQIQMAAEAGVRMVSFPVPMPWPEPGQEPDWSRVDEVCATVLAANPDALLIPRIGTSPPAWWRKAHPSEMMVWDRGPVEREDVCVASEAWRSDVAERLTAIIEHLETKFGPHMAGYHPCGQNTGEWFYQGTWQAPLSGYSEASQKAWRAWLKREYVDDARLQAGWRNNKATLAAADVPSPELRRAAPHGLLRDPRHEQMLLDFARFQQQTMGETVCHLARVVRQATRGRKLVLFFYGYTFEFASVPNGAAISGHYNLRRVLDSPDIDLLCSPISYWDRGQGGTAPAMTAAESVALAGKMWLSEDDTATYLSSGIFPGHREKVDTWEESRELLVRNTAQCAIRNFATWWMDLGATGWFHDPRLWEGMRALAPLDQAMLRSPRAYRPEVAAVVDESSMLLLSARGNTVGRPAVYEARRPLGRMGAPYGQYLLDDAVAARVDAKLLVFLSAWQLSPAQREKLREAVAGRCALWCYAPGVYDFDGPASPAAMQDLTGFALRPAGSQQAWAEPTEAGRSLGLTEGFGVRAAVRPLFAAADATPEETLATYPDGSAAVALRRMGDGWSMFVGPPGVTSELLRVAARKAGVHLYTETDCNVYANGPFVALHAAKTGPVQLRLRSAGTVRDMLTGQELGMGKTLRLELELGQTRVLEMIPE